MRTLSLLALCAIAAPLRAADPDYATEVRPILAAACFKCHGPDDKARKAKLRLDIDGKIDGAELITRITSADADSVMPPPATKVTLTAMQKDILKRWVAAGTPHPAHWAFVPPKRHPIPASPNARNPIDAFIAAKLRERGLSPAPETDKVTLIRRVSLDLIGLPPTPSEVDAFLADTSTDAYERLVDRLLASPHYGERWARRWLDLARYADTNGYEKDRARSIWPYRDWVIGAINADLPFDRFGVEQLAGDLLPDATIDQQIATGFHRNTMLNEEGGIDPLEFRFHAMTDRVATTGATWLGMTLGCAQCHTHKYDPITHREYFGVMAFLNNADEPELDLAGGEPLARRIAAQNRVDQLIADLPARYPGDLEADFTKWLAAERERARKWTPLRPTSAKSNSPHLAVEADGSVMASGDMTKSDTYDVAYLSSGPVKAIRLEVLPDERLPAGGPGRVFYEGPKGEFFLSEFAVIVDGKKLPLADAAVTFPANTKAGVMFDGDQQSGWGINGAQGKPNAATFRLASSIKGPFAVQMLFERYYAAGLGRFRVSVSDDDKAETRISAVESLLRIADGELSSKQRGDLRREFLLTTPILTEARKPIDEARQAVPALPTTLVMRERPAANPRETFLHHRGEFLQPAERVAPSVPAVLPPVAGKADRLGFARWLFDPKHPLTARVAANRQWAAFFGRGIVRTVEDFGIQGEPPTHPELLDWLANALMNDDWSMKRLHRLIVTSGTYRQSSRVTADGLAKDADNRWLGRMSRVRLEGEVIRDSVLRGSGLLSAKVGGPSVFPPQPPGVSTEGTYGGLAWKPSEGEDRYRRTLYTFAKRTAPFAMLGTFDAPSGEACVARRDVSNTALQALTLMNDPMFAEAARAVGKEFAAMPGTTEDRMRLLFRRFLTREPQRDELEIFVGFIGARSNLGEPAAWAAVARVVFNLDEMVTKN